MKVVAVVVTYNRKELLKECIEALISQENKCDILVVDNASTDGTMEYINEYIETNKIIYKNTGSNLGGAGGFNYGMKEACKLDCDYIWVMDDDCIVKNDSLTKLLDADKKLNGNYGFLASKVLWKDGSICKMNIPKRSLRKKVTDWNIPIQKIIMATFVSFFVKVDKIKELGLPIKEFFIWSDDLEYSRRISRKYDCYLINDSIVIHKSKFNIGSNISVDDKKNLWRYEYAYRNEYYLHKQNLIWKLYYKLKIILHKYRINKSESLSAEDKLERIELIDKAIKKGKNFNPKIEYLEEKL